MALSMAQGEEGHLELSAIHRLERCVKAGAWCQYVPVPNSRLGLVRHEKMLVIKYVKGLTI